MEPTLIVNDADFPALHDVHKKQVDNDWQVVVPADQEEVPVMVDKVWSSQPQRIQSLLHCYASSPDLRKLHDIDEVDEHDDFSIVSDASLHSNWSTLSFKDAVMQQQQQPACTNSMSDNDDDDDDDAVDNNKQMAGHRRSRAQQRKIRSKIMVVQPAPIYMRHAKSTGDLQSLGKIAEHEEEDHDDDAILGETDAVEFYQRKAMGEQGRINGLKLRPDEITRRSMSQAKKAEQRQNQ